VGVVLQCVQGAPQIVEARVPQDVKREDNRGVTRGAELATTNDVDDVAAPSVSDRS